MAINDKYHFKIGNYGFLLARSAALDRHLYQRDEAPSFVNKFASGEPNYRDSTFFSHWVQLDFLNGFNQEFFDDPSKFYFSDAVDTTTLQQLTLEKRFSAAGQTVAGDKITTQIAWRDPGTSYFGTGSDGVLHITADTTEVPIDSVASGISGSTSLNATNASFAAGQKILIHQTRGNNVGTKLVTTILSYSAGLITTKDPLNITYTSSGADAAQVRVIPQYSSVTVDAAMTYSPKAWDGNTGGIICFNTLATTITGTISASGKGFRGGLGEIASGANFVGFQGESEIGIGIRSQSANASAGGGGKYQNGLTAGGGGGYATAGSNGGNSSPAQGGAGGTGGGTDGIADLSKLMFGGGGGAGGSGDPNVAGGSGGAGGGIVFISCAGITVTGAVISAGADGITGGTGDGSHYSGSGGGAGAGGSILLMVQTATLGATLVTAPAGAGGSGHLTRGVTSGTGGAGGVGRIHISYLTSFTGTTTPTIDSFQDGTLVSVQTQTSFTHLVGTSTGGIYSWDGASIYTQLFDTRRLAWYETGVDTDKVVGDTGGTETAQAQGFTIAAVTNMKAVQVYLKKSAGTPGAITVRIETNGASKPSGTLVDPSATTTIPAFTTSSYGWINVEFPTSFALSASTVYWIVLETAAAANDNNYSWGVDGSSPTYAASTMAVSTDGGSSWSTVSASDAYFRVLGEATSVNTSLLSDLTGSTKAYFGVGDQTSTLAGGARLYDYDGSVFTLKKTFTGANEASINTMISFGVVTPGVYLGLGSKAKIYFTADFTTFVLSKTITEPRNPGHVLAFANYAGKLYAGGGYPELLTNNNYQYSGFLYSYDEYDWVGPVGSFEHTVITCLETFDTLLFIGSIKKRLYVFNTATIDKLFEFPWDVQMTKMRKWDDKLAVALAPRPGAAATGNEGIYLFDRNGLHRAFSVAGRSWYSLFVFNNNLMGGNDDGYVYQTSATTYQDSGTMQLSYFEAQLPSVDKLLREVTLQTTAILTGCSIKVEYRSSEDATWVLLGLMNTVSSTEATFTFPDSVFYKKVSLRITLITTVPANTPTLKKVITKYQLAPDFKYIWKMTVVCPDNVEWLDNTEPVGELTSPAVVGNITMALSDVSGFPDPAGSTYFASIVDENDLFLQTFTYTGKSGNTLTGIPTTGAFSLTAHAAGTKVKILGRDIHRNLIALKRNNQFYDFTDIDGAVYKVYFASYQTDGWAIDTTKGFDVEENEAPITILEA